MAFSGGTFSRTFDCTTDRDNGVKILASKFDTELDGMATGLSTCILKDGTQTCTAAIPFAEGLTVPDNKTIVLGTNSDITIQYDESTNDSLEIAANVEGAGLGIVLKADQGDDNADQHKVNIADGGTLTMASKISGSFVSYLTHTPNSTVASSTTAVAGHLTVGGDLTLGSGAVITEAELEAIDGITAGTVTASKAVIVDSNKDIASFRNVTLTGELDAGSLDVSGDADIDGTLEADAMTLNGTAITATATLDTGISNNNVPKFTSGVADDDFLRVAGTAIEGRSASEVLSDIGAQASLTFGISNTNAVKIDSSSVADDEYARFTANGLESRATSEVLSDIGAAPAAGSSNIVTTGAVNSGSITSGFGSIDNGSSAISTTGTMTYGSLSDGSITITAFVDEDNMASDSATLVPTQQSVKAYVDSNSGVASFRNMILNGQMTISQRSASVSSITSTGYHTLDRFNLLVESLGTWTMSQDTDVPTGYGFAKSLKIDCTTADGSPAVADRLFLRQTLEGQDLQQMKKGTSNAESVTLSFWVKATKTGTHIINLYDNDNSRYIAQAYTVSSSNTWEHKSLTFAGDTTGAFDNDNAGSLQIVWWLASGTNNTSGTLQTSWGSATAANRAVGQVNTADSTSNNFAITGVQLEIGTSSSAFEFRTHADNLIACQRYYQIGAFLAGSGNSSNFRTTVSFSTPMRAQPTLSTPSNAFKVTDGYASDYASTNASPAWVTYFEHQGGVVGTSNHASVSGDARRGTMHANNVSGVVAVDNLEMDSEL